MGMKDMIIAGVFHASVTCEESNKIDTYMNSLPAWREFKIAENLLKGAISVNDPKAIVECINEIEECEKALKPIVEDYYYNVILPARGEDDGLKWGKFDRDDPPAKVKPTLNPTDGVCGC